jgi:enoyl-CoA hydratase
MNLEHCLVERDGHVLVVTLNRPEAKNALSGGMLAGMYRARRGLFPLGGSSVRLRRQIPYTLAAEILLTARHVTAKEALDFGLVGRVVPSGQALAEAKKIAAQICENAPLSIRALMRMLREVDESYSEADALVQELEIGGPVFASRDAREGPRAFAEKRKPVYRGE